MDDTNLSLIPGTVLILGRRRLEVPPLSFRDIKKLRGLLLEVEQMQQGAIIPSDAELDKICKIVHTAVIQNYPDIREDDVDAMINLNNAREVLQACILGVNKQAGDSIQSVGKTASQ